MKKFYLNKLLLVLAAIVVSFFNVIPVGAVPDFYSDSNIQFYDPTACDPTGGSGASGDLDGSENAEKAFNFFVSKGWKDYQAAGIVGNLSVESNVEPQRLQGTPAGTETPANSFTSGGWGIAQWTQGSKFINPVKASGKDPNDLQVQLEVIDDGLNDKAPLPEKTAGDQLKTTNNVTEATEAFQGSVGNSPYSGYERPASRTATIGARTAAAKATLRKYGGGTAAASSTTSTDATGNSSCACSETNTTSTSDIDINTKLSELSSDNGGKTMISVSTIDGGTKGSSGGNTQMPTRSSYKLYTAYATLRAIEDNKISWSTRVWGSKSVKDTMEAMIVQSNNDAAEALRLNSTIGNPTTVTNMLQNDVGLSNKTVMGSGSAGAAAGSNSKSTANDYVKFLTLLKKKNLKGVKEDTSYETLIGFMKRATTDGGSARDGIVAGVGAGTKVADKPGWASGSIDPASNDVGIVYLSGKPYAVAILTDKPNKWDGVAKIAKAVNELMGGAASGTDCGDSGAVLGDFSATVKAYAWPEYHAAPYTRARPAYKRAVEAAQREGLYVGGETYPGIDCGGYVSRVMLDSGFEPEYNSSGEGGFTGDASNENTQWGWLDKNWEKISVNSTGDLRPGDVAMRPNHTYMYVGDINGWSGDNKVFSSSSLDTRAPMAGQGDAMASGDVWYRKK